MSDNMDEPYYEHIYCEKCGALHELEAGVSKHRCKAIVGDARTRKGNDVMEYLGDGVYVEIKPFGIELTTSDGLTTTNTIFLDFDILESFRMWIQSNEEKGLL